MIPLDIQSRVGQKNQTLTLSVVKNPTPPKNLQLHKPCFLVHSFQLLDSDIVQLLKWLISYCWTAQTDSHLFTAIQFIGMSF